MTQMQLIQSNTIPSAHFELLQIFAHGYFSMCTEMDSACQEELASITPLVFGKWYHSALIENTPLSPTNLLQKEFPKQENTVQAYVLQSDTDHKTFTPTLLSYSTKEHPFVEDLRILTDFCHPAKEMDEHLFFLEKDHAHLLHMLSQQSDFYLEYLTRMAWRLGLFAIFPSIHVKKIQQSAYCTIFWQKNTEEILKEIAGCACELAAERFSFSMDLDDGVAQSAFFYNCLSNPQETDRIFIDFYHQVDVNIEEIWKLGPSEMSEDDSAIISSCLFTGIMLDKWFFYPMSQFLQFLAPISFLPMKYFYLVNNLAALITMKRNVGAEIFSPPSYYMQTNLGKCLFPPKEELVPKYPMRLHDSLSELLCIVQSEQTKMRIAEKFHTQSVGTVVSLRIAVESSPEFWKTIEMPDSMPLDVFCRDIFSAFHIESVEDYAISILDENNFPILYSTEKSKKSFLKTTGKTLANLNLQNGRTFRILSSLGKSFHLFIETMDNKKGNVYILYPRVSAQSDAFTEEEQNDELF